MSLDAAPGPAVVPDKEGQIVTPNVTGNEKKFKALVADFVRPLSAGCAG